MRTPKELVKVSVMPCNTPVYLILTLLIMPILEFLF